MSCLVSHFAISSLRIRNGFALISQLHTCMNSRGLIVHWKGVRGEQKQLMQVCTAANMHSCKYAHLQASGQEASLEIHFYHISFVNDWQQNLWFLLLICPKPKRELAQVISISGSITFYWLLLVCFSKFFLRVMTLLAEPSCLWVTKFKFEFFSSKMVSFHLWQGNLLFFLMHT